MKKKVIILGSTGSIGNKTFKIFKKDKKNFQVFLLSTLSNLKKVMNQANELNVKNILINDIAKFEYAKKVYKNKNLNFYNKFEDIENILKKKNIYYSMVSVSGLDGLKPTIILSKYSKNLAIVNKESLICGWNIIKKNLDKFKTNFIPIDSEHYSIFNLLKNNLISDVEKVYITASGGPFLNYSTSKLKSITPKKALKHPNWRMGKKISIDSATLMNKVFEVIEAKNIFNLTYNKISILTHPNSYVHAIIKFNNGIIKILVHEPNMNIPIHNSIYGEVNNKLKSKKLNLEILNKLLLKKVNNKQFPMVKLLDKLPKINSLYETILVTINDHFVYMFLENKINYPKLIYLITKYVNLKEFVKYKKIKPKKIEDIYKLRNYVSLKLSRISI